MNSFTRTKTQEEIKAFQAEKNLNDFIYQTNTKLQSLSQSLIALSLSLEKVKSYFENSKKDLSIQMENLKEQVVKEADDTGHLLADYATASIDLTDKVQKKFESIEKSMLTVDVFTKMCSFLDSRFNEIEKKLDIEKAYINSALILVNGQISEQIRLVREDLTPKPQSSDPIKEAIVEHLKPIQIDFKGLIKEIELLKKATRYADKKFENIYTLIERLKGEKDVTSR